MRRIKKTLTRANPIEIIVENQLPIGLTTMRFLLFIAFAAGLLILERPIIFGETFTEGIRVSPEAVTLKPGEYVWEPERAPEGPLSIAMVSKSAERALRTPNSFCR
jgi:hypothetical protein